MSGPEHPTPSEIRARLSHPVIDGDGHWPEDSLVTLDDFRDCTFGNAGRLWGQVNPRFFEGTAVAKAAAGVLGNA